jgi:hypothetical protein
MTENPEKFYELNGALAMRPIPAQRTTGGRRVAPWFLSLSKFYYAKRRFSVTSKYRQMHGVLNVDEIKN